MTTEENPDVTAYLQQLADGNREVLDDLVELVYGDLRNIAVKMFGNQQMTLQPTALVNEAYLRLAQHPGAPGANRQHFFRVAAMAMRQILADHARRRKAVKRGGEQKRANPEGACSQIAAPDEGGPELDLEALHDALTELEELDPRQAQVVALRYLTGLSTEQTAEVLETSPRTVRRDWQMARAWLEREIKRRTEHPGA